MIKCMAQSRVIKGDIAQLEELKKFDLKVASSIQLCATIFLPTKFACLYTSLQLEIQNQNE